MADPSLPLGKTANKVVRHRMWGELLCRGGRKPDRVANIKMLDPAATCAAVEAVMHYTPFNYP